jgi:hypothetical protein
MVDKELHACRSAALRIFSWRPATCRAEPTSEHQHEVTAGAGSQQHLDNLRRKDALRGAATTEISVRLGSYSASHFEGSAYRGCRIDGKQGSHSPSATLSRRARTTPKGATALYPFQ